jgi:hypothetical protein
MRVHSKTLSLSFAVTSLAVTADVTLADGVIDKDIFLQSSTISISARKER